MEGYGPAVAFGIADIVVLTADAQGAVVAVGRVPAAFSAAKLARTSRS